MTCRPHYCRSYFWPRLSRLTSLWICLSCGADGAIFLTSRSDTNAFISLRVLHVLNTSARNANVSVYFKHDADLRMTFHAKLLNPLFFGSLRGSPKRLLTQGITSRGPWPGFEPLTRESFLWPEPTLRACIGFPTSLCLRGLGKPVRTQKCTKVLIYWRSNITNLDGRLLRRRGFVGNGKRRIYSSSTLKAAATDFLNFRQVSIRRIKSTMR